MRAHNGFVVGFYLRQNRNKAQDYGIYCCIKVAHSNSRELCIQNGILEKDWNSHKGCPKSTTPELQKLALLLETIKSKLLNIYLDLKLTGNEVSAEIIKNIYLGENEINYTILQLTDIAIEKYKKEIEKGSPKNYHATRSYLADFCKAKYRSGFIANRIVMGINDYFQVLFIFLQTQIHRYHDPQYILYLVGYFFQQPVGICKTDYLIFIIFSNVR